MKQKLPKFSSWEFYSSLNLVEKEEYNFIKNGFDKAMIFVYIILCCLFVLTLFNKFRILSWFITFVIVTLIFSWLKKEKVFVRKIVESKGA